MIKVLSNNQKQDVPNIFKKMQIAKIEYKKSTNISCTNI